MDRGDACTLPPLALVGAAVAGQPGPEPPPAISTAAAAAASCSRRGCRVPVLAQGGDSADGLPAGPSLSTELAAEPGGRHQAPVGRCRGQDAVAETLVGFGGWRGVGHAVATSA